MTQLLSWLHSGNRPLCIAAAEPGANSSQASDKQTISGITGGGFVILVQPGYPGEVHGNTVTRGHFARIFF